MFPILLQMIRKTFLLVLFIVSLFITEGTAQKKPKIQKSSFDSLWSGLKWRNIGPFRGGRSVASCGVAGDPLTYYMGTTGGGVWKTTDAGENWTNISDGQLATGTVGAIAVAPSDPNVIYVGMGEHAIRGVMTSSGDGIYKSTDAGRTWKHIGLPESQHISDIVIHPEDPDIVFVSVQGAQYGPTSQRGIYKSTDGGRSWKNVLFIDKNTGASSLTIDPTNPRILYGAMWEHRRYPWTMQSGGPGSGLFKSTDMGETWEKMNEGLPKEMGKAGITVSPANPDRVWAVIEAAGEKGGVYRSDDRGKKWTQLNKDRVNIARSWYYMEIFADPNHENVVYVLNAPVMKSIDGGRSFAPVSTPHGDNHHLWINPANSDWMINSNDGGSNVSLDGGRSWSTQKNQPTAQFYRVITDNQVPYHIYGGQQDNSAIGIASRDRDNGIDWKDWYSVAGCESAYLAFDPDDPQMIYGGCYQGIIDRWERASGLTQSIKAYPELALGNVPKELKYRFNWNAPIISSPHDRNTIYHAGNVVFKTQDGGINWEVISPDLTRNDTTKQGPGGGPFTNEAAGGENYNTIMYLTESPHEEGVIWSGSDDGLVYLTRDGGENWQNVTPSGMPEGIVNAIEVSSHDPAKAYIVVMRYKFNDLSPYIYMTKDYGASWKRIDDGIRDPYTFIRVVREDRKVSGLLYAGSETGLYVSWDDGQNWEEVQLNLPVVAINDLTIQDNDLVAATAGRSFWILDDLGAFQQGKNIIGNDQSYLFEPKPQYRMEGSTATDYVAGLGQNPMQGIAFDYYLPEKDDSLEFSIEILDQSGNILRTYSNAVDESFASWPGGPPKPDVLPAEKGVNRFAWDLRRETLPAVDKVFVYGDYRGSKVGPGRYTIRMILKEDTLRTTARLLPDPAVGAKPSDFAEQQEILTEIEDIIGNMHESVNDLRSARQQLSTYQKLLEDRAEAQALLDTAAVIQEAITIWERKLIQPNQKTFQDVINFNNKLNAELMNLKTFIDGPFPMVTTGARKRFKDLRVQWQQFAEERDRILQVDMMRFNEMYRELKLPAIILDR
mgnify:CR=1 FL=1